jgi:hypothetical protein
MTQLPELRTALVDAASRRRETIRAELDQASGARSRAGRARVLAFSVLAGSGATIAVLVAAGVFASRAPLRHSFPPAPSDARWTGYRDVGVLLSPPPRLITRGPTHRTSTPTAVGRTCFVASAGCEEGCVVQVAETPLDRPSSPSMCPSTTSVHPCTLYVTSVPRVKNPPACRPRRLEPRRELRTPKRRR